MAITEHASGTTSALVIGTETFLGTDPDTTDGVFQFIVNTINMARGDVLEIRLYEAALSGDSVSDQIFVPTLQNAQDDDLWISPTMIFLHRWRFSLKQTAGTGRTYKWSIRKVA